LYIIKGKMGRNFAKKICGKIEKTDKFFVKNLDKKFAKKSKKNLAKLQKKNHRKNLIIKLQKY